MKDQTNEFSQKSFLEFSSSDPVINEVISKSKDYLTDQNLKLDSLYVFSTIKSGDSVEVMLIHYNLLKQIENKEDGQWIVLPPLNSLSDQARKLTYQVQEDRIVEFLVITSL